MLTVAGVRTVSVRVWPVRAVSLWYVVTSLAEGLPAPITPLKKSAELVRNARALSGDILYCAATSTPALEPVKHGRYGCYLLSSASKSARPLQIRHPRSWGN